MKHSSVLIPDAESHRALDVVRALALAGDGPIHLVSTDRNAMARFSRHARTFRHAPVDADGTAWMEAVTDTVRRHGADVLLPVSQEGIELASRFGSTLSTLLFLPPLPTPSKLSVVSNKWSLHERARELGIQVPPAIPGTLTSFRQNRTELRFPVLLKPTTGNGGGQGILRFNEPDSLLRHLETMAEPEGAPTFMIQNYEEGTDWGCNVLCREGRILAATTQRGVTTAHAFGPVRAVEMTDQPALLDVASRLCAELSWDGVANMDFILPHGQSHPKLLEMNPRYWGSLTASILCGVNFPHLARLAATGEPIPPPVQQHALFAMASELFSRERRRRLPIQIRKSLRLRNTSLYYSIRDPLPGLMHQVLATFR